MTKGGAAARPMSFLVKETVEGGAGFFGRFEGAGSVQIEGLDGSVEAAGVLRVLVGDPDGDRLGALEAYRGVEIRALPARVEVGAALLAGRIAADVLEVLPLVAAGAAGKNDRLVEVDTASARAFGPGAARARMPPDGLVASGILVAAVAVLAFVAHKRVNVR